MISWILNRRSDLERTQAKRSFSTKRAREDEMPLVPRYTWEEDVSSLTLELHLPGIPLRNIDIYGKKVFVRCSSS